MPFIGRRDLLNQLNISQLQEIGRKYDIYLPSKTTKTGIISRLMDLPKSTIEEEVHVRL
uniref:Uncharacterized protein n=1 Tax=Marseillevirus LCMAC101 TaxID=2506602 RepID=A0A481YT47_9VIRU|nr:MAG: hypothetical protein LCMAC101_05400 [Marseillevirus LCMAC101]